MMKRILVNKFPSRPFAISAIRTPGGTFFSKEHLLDEFNISYPRGSDG
jgi:hypothetical protein